jgi:hypothetical protein
MRSWAASAVTRTFWELLICFVSPLIKYRRRIVTRALVSRTRNLAKFEIKEDFSFLPHDMGHILSILIRESRKIEGRFKNLTFVIQCAQKIAAVLAATKMKVK